MQVRNSPRDQVQQRHATHNIPPPWLPQSPYSRWGSGPSPYVVTAVMPPALTEPLACSSSSWLFWITSVVMAFNHADASPQQDVLRDAARVRCRDSTCLDEHLLEDFVTEADRVSRIRTVSHALPRRPHATPSSLPLSSSRLLCLARADSSKPQTRVFVQPYPFLCAARKIKRASNSN